MSASPHTFLVWRTVDRDGIPSHHGTAPIGTALGFEARISDRRSPGRAPHTVEAMRVDWRCVDDVDRRPFERVEDEA